MFETFPNVADVMVVSLPPKLLGQAVASFIPATDLFLIKTLILNYSQI